MPRGEYLPENNLSALIFIRHKKGATGNDNGFLPQRTQRTATATAKILLRQTTNGKITENGNDNGNGNGINHE
ncbi:MAG: hypothetical protein GY794_15110 [bacterium]|nr:hypothetical protein [bacterium]